jgi:hypothetical protein
MIRILSHFAVAERHLARLTAVKHHVGAAALALLRRSPGYLCGGQLQDGLNGGASGHVDQFVAGHLALLDQIDHRQHPLPVVGQKLGQFALVGFSLLAYRVIAFPHGGSPFKVWQPDSTESGWTAAQLSTIAGTSSKPNHPRHIEP